MSTSKKSYKTIDEYIKLFPKDFQEILMRLRQVIHNAAPEAEEAISYQIPTFKLNSNLVHFAGYKNHIGFYPTPSAINEFKKELGSYQVSKGTIKFPIDKPIPLDLVRRIVEYRVLENSKRK